MGLRVGTIPAGPEAPLRRGGPSLSCTRRSFRRSCPFLPVRPWRSRRPSTETRVFLKMESRCLGSEAGAATRSPSSEEGDAKLGPKSPAKRAEASKTGRMQGQEAQARRKGEVAGLTETKRVVFCRNNQQCHSIIEANLPMHTARARVRVFRV